MSLKNVFGNPGLALVSDRIIDYLDYDDLVNAAKTCQTWHDEIMSRDSLWKKRFDRACSEWRHYYGLREEEEGDQRGYCSEWTDENLEIFKETGSNEDLCLLIELIKKLMEHCDEIDRQPSAKLRFYDPPAPRLLQLAAEFGLCKLTKNLIEKGAQVNHAPGDLHGIGMHFHLAIENGKFETVKLLNF